MASLCSSTLSIAGDGRSLAPMSRGAQGYNVQTSKSPSVACGAAAAQALLIAVEIMQQ